MPITLSPRRREILVNFLKRHFDDMASGLQARNERVARAIRQWEAKSRPKNFPWPNCSSLRAPMEAIVRDAIIARLLNALQGSDRDIEVQPVIDKQIPYPNPSNPRRNLTWRDIADRWEMYLLTESTEGGALDFRQYQVDLIEESTLTGTGVSKWWWESIIEREGESMLDVATEGNIRARVLRLENFLFAKGYDTLERIPLVGEKYTLRPSERLQRIDSHGWDRSEVLRYLRDHGRDSAEPLESDIDASEREDESSDVYTSREQWIAEVWIRVSFERGADDDSDDGLGGREAKLLVDCSFDHPEYIFRVEPWIYDHGETPYPNPAQYIRRRGRLLGMGIPERAEDLSTALSTTLNQIIDASTIANVPVWSVNQNIPSLRQLSSVHPGKVIFRGEDPNDFRPEKMGSIGPDIFQGFNIIRTLLEQITKVSDFNLGRESSVTGQASTATTTLALLAESGQYFDNINRGYRKHINEGLWRWMALIHQHKPIDRIRLVLGSDDAEILALVLDKLSLSDIQKRLAVKVAFSNTAASRELARQEEMAKFQILQTYYTALVDMAQLLVTQPIMKPLLDDIARSADRKMRQLLETFGENFATNDLPRWDDFSDMAAEYAQQMQANVVNVPQGGENE